MECRAGLAGSMEPVQTAMNSSDLKDSPAPRAKRAAVRAGRPPKELAGEVDARILDAARHVFLERGFEGASIDEIAEEARSGKRTIYARFQDKRALFIDVVTRDILSRIAAYKAETPMPTDGTIEERLTRVASTLLHWGLDNAKVRLMRLAIAEVHRFPELAATVNRRARALSTELGADLLRELTSSDEIGSLPAFAPERLPATARLFLDIVAIPILFRAMFELDLNTIEPEIDAHVARGVKFFVAACRNDGVLAPA